MRIRFRHALGMFLGVLIASEVLQAYQRPLIVDNWEGIVYKGGDNGQLLDTRMKLSVNRHGLLLKDGFTVRYEFEGENKAEMQSLGFNPESFTDAEGPWQYFRGHCQIKDWKLQNVRHDVTSIKELGVYQAHPHVSAFLSYPKDGCPDFELGYAGYDKIFYRAYHNGRPFVGILERDTRHGLITGLINRMRAFDYGENPGT